jgi:hypothetical protein
VKRATILSAVALATGAVGWNAVEFVGGYNVFPLTLGFLPTSLFLLAFTASATCVVAVIILVVLFRRRFRYALLLVSTIAACWLVSPWFAGRSAFLLGLATRLHKLSTPDEIRAVAQTCLSAMPGGGQIFGPRKIVGPKPDEAEQNQRAWSAISKYPFVHLDGDTCVVFVRPPEVSFTWGGALPGHWGILVGSPPPHQPYFHHQTIRFAEGIILFRGE